MGLPIGHGRVTDLVTEWSVTCNTPLWPLLGLTPNWIGPIQSISWSYQALAPICFILTVLLNLHLQQVPNPYLLGARRWWLRVNYIERRGIWPVLRIWNWQRLKNLLSAWIYWLCIPISTKVNGFLPCYITNTSWTPWWVMEHRASEKYTAFMTASNKKKTQPIRNREWGSRLPQIHCYCIFGKGLPSQIGGQPEADRKH